MTQFGSSTDILAWKIQYNMKHSSPTILLFSCSLVFFLESTGAIILLYNKTVIFLLIIRTFWMLVVYFLRPGLVEVLVCVA